MSQQDEPDRPPATAAGWYPDPWVSGARRYWTGAQWTAMSFPDRTVGDQAGAAARAGETNPFADRSAAPTEVPPPAWVRPDTAPPAPTETVVIPVGATESSVASGTRGRRWAIAAVSAAAVLALALIAGFVANRGSSPSAAPRPAPSPTPSPSSPGAPTPSPSSPGSVTPRPADIGALARLGLRQSDVQAGVVVLPIDGGLQVEGEKTLDLCDGTFPSESQRVSRVQVGGYLGDGTVGLSTEAVQYASTGSVDQAWDEIGAAARTCSTSSPGTTLDPSSGDTWPHVPGVRRLAYDLQTVDASGATQRYVVVYLSRGNILLGVYFPHPEGAQLSVVGQDSVAGIVHVFEKRLAELPPAGLPDVSGPGGVGPTA